MKNQQQNILRTWAIILSVLFLTSWGLQVLLLVRELEVNQIAGVTFRSLMLVLAVIVLAVSLVRINYKKYRSFPDDFEAYKNDVFSVVLRKPLPGTVKLMTGIVPLLIISPLPEITREGRELVFRSWLPQLAFGELVLIKMEPLNKEATLVTVTGRHVFRAQKMGYGQSGAGVRKIKKFLRQWKKNLDIETM